MTTRRSFLHGLLSLGATAATGIAHGYTYDPGAQAFTLDSRGHALAEEMAKHGMPPGEAFSLMMADTRGIAVEPDGCPTLWREQERAGLLAPYLDAKARYGHEAAELQPFVPIDPTPQSQRYDFPVRTVGSREVVIDEEGTRRWVWVESVPIHTARITGVRS